METIESFSPEDTFEYGRQCGLMAEPGQVFCLCGDLGVGKTVFTQGFARGLGINEPVSSPTFTIVQIYEDGRMPFYHFDVYRISDPEEMYEVGFDDYIEGEGVCFIEWAGLIEELLPERRTEITISKDLTRGFDYRLITRREITA
ncbi:MAG: tRNA (adenosine(37)-N6)-threonylcarbamoyltransferase complex ATPase subunit type 1 TsaE [Eubacterium sp.]|nr:tRNA (adenosine(37)-N6)-threonylcarbamoyltransferase complex ATPase subunit type 1 TsaE [Eubacterium sp.]